MADNCKTVSFESLPRILSTEPIPDYSYPLSVISTKLTAIENLLEEQRAQDIEIVPQPTDEDNYIGTVQTCTALAITTITWTFESDYIYYFKSVYVDKQANMSYVWTFQSTTDAQGAKVIDGNEHDFNGRPIKARGKSTLSLAMTNTSSTAMDHDIMIQSWARRVK